MVAFSLQTVLLMVVAYFLGAALACVIRRSLFAQRPQPAERRVDPLPEVAQRSGEAVRFGRSAKPAPPPAEPRPAVQPAPPPPAPDGPQDLKRIRLIDATTEAQLNTLGVNRYDQIASWKREDVRRASEALGSKGRVNQENWIEQAHILSQGGDTLYSARRARGEAAIAAPSPDEGGRSPQADAAPLPRTMSRAGVAATVVAPPATGSSPASAVAAPLASPPLVAERAAFAGRAASGQGQSAAAAVSMPDVPAAVPVRPVAATRDNLQRIGGITPEIEQQLIAQGVSRYAQIAQWAPSDVERFDAGLGMGGRIARENWVEQAQILSRGGDTRFSREYDAGTGRPPETAGSPGGSVKRTDLGSLRSVRSQAYRDASEPGPEAAQRAAAQNKVLRPSASNDLKRIRGIGVLIEKKLNALGVTTYEHVANWTASDIERVSQSLDFKGRIERENWVEQARILSVGGQTEFSRRVDRGDVETSRAKT